MTNIKSPLFVVLLLAASFVPAAFAEVETFTKEYTYRASDADSKITSRAIALDQIKKLLLEEIGVFVQSTFLDKSGSNGKTKDEVREEIITLTAGVVMATVVAEKWDGVTYWLRAEIKADPADVARSVERLRRDRQKSRELAELRARLEESNGKIARLREELSSGKESGKKLAEYGKAVGELTATDWNHKAGIYIQAGRYTEAISAADKATELNPNDTFSYNLRTRAYLELGDNRKAEENIEAALRINPNDGTAHNNRGAVFGNAGDYKKALPELDEAIRLGEKDAVNYANRGAVHFKLGDKQKALDDFNEALKADPESALAYANRGIFYHDTGDKMKALDDLDDAIRLNPNYENAYFNRAVNYFELENDKMAIKDFDMVIKLNPNRGEAYSFRGGSYIRLSGHLQEGMSDMKMAAKLGDKPSQDFLKRLGMEW